MLKRILAAIMFLPFALAGVAAQLTATLQSGDTFTPFYGMNAFIEAHNAAIDGDVITLSPGRFTSVEITKAITVIGAYAFSQDTSQATIMGDLTVSSDNVSLEGIRLNDYLTINAVNNFTVKRSYIFGTKDTENGEKKFHDNTIMVDCMIYEYGAMNLSKNAVFRNCCINYFTDLNESQYPALIENCNIPIFCCDTRTYCRPYAVYRNCFLGFYKDASNTSAPVLNLYSPSEFHNVIFYFNYRFTKTSNYAEPWKFYFNSCITENVKMGESKYGLNPSSESFHHSSFSPYTFDGLTVGPEDVKEYPAIPVITSSKIDSSTDEEGKLHVKISASARD